MSTVGQCLTLANVATNSAVWANLAPANISTTGATSGYVLTDVSGTAAWAAPATTPGFAQYTKSTTTALTGDGATVTVIYDTTDVAPVGLPNLAYSTSTGTFTQSTATNTYMFTFSANNNSNTSWYLSLLHNGTSAIKMYNSGFYVGTEAAESSVFGNKIVTLASGDTVSLVADSVTYNTTLVAGAQINVVKLQ